jgi:hypothetical protein
MILTDAERDALKAQFPAHWFCRIVRDGWQLLLAIPKRADDPPIPSMPGMNLSMLHGATIRLSYDDARLLEVAA